VDGPGEHLREQQQAPPEWAAPGFGARGASLYPNGVVPTWVAIASRFQVQADDLAGSNAAKSLAQLVGSGTASASGWSPDIAGTLFGYFSANNVTDGVAPEKPA
jgi:hypothetical protein